MKETLKAYMAGLIDGEGSIMLSKQHSYDEFRMPVISLTNTSFNIIDLLKKTFGGTICNQKLYQVHHTPAKIWRVCYDRAVNICVMLLPYFKHTEKIRRAQLIATRYKQCTVRNGKYTENQRQAKLQFQHDFFHPSTTH